MRTKIELTDYSMMQTVAQAFLQPFAEQQIAVAAIFFPFSSLLQPNLNLNIKGYKYT